MGTSAVVKFYINNEFISGVRFHYDGYLSGVGKKLVEFLDNIEIVNIIRPNMKKENYKYANGVECLIAQYISLMKTEIGNVYISTVDQCGSYTYDVYFNNYDYNNIVDSIVLDFESHFPNYDKNNISINVNDCWDDIFSGSIKELNKYIENKDDYY